MWRLFLKQFNGRLHLLYYSGSLLLHKSCADGRLLLARGKDFIVLLSDSADLLLHLSYSTLLLNSSEQLQLVALTRGYQEKCWREK